MADKTTKELIDQALEQMAYCSKDGRKDSLCPCCFGKVQFSLQEAWRKADADERVKIAISESDHA